MLPKLPRGAGIGSGVRQVDPHSRRALRTGEKLSERAIRALLSALGPALMPRRVPAT